MWVHSAVCTHHTFGVVNHLDHSGKWIVTYLVPQTFNMSWHGTHNQEILQLPAFYNIRLKISWRINDGLYSQFMLLKQKCKVILNCQLELASDWCKTKSVLQWSGNCGLEIYNSRDIKDTQHDILKEYWRQCTPYCQTHTNSQFVEFDLWHNSTLKDTIEEHYASILNKAQIAFQRHCLKRLNRHCNVMHSCSISRPTNCCRNVYVKSNSKLCQGSHQNGWIK